MSTSVFDNRIALRPEVVALFRATAGPEIQRVVTEVKSLREQAARILEKAGDGDRYIAEIQQALRDVESSADLPMPLPTTQQQGDARAHADTFGGPHTGLIAPLICQCGDSMVYDEKRGAIHPVEGGWESAGDDCKRVQHGTSLLPPTGDGVS